MRTQIAILLGGLLFSLTTWAADNSASIEPSASETAPSTMSESHSSLAPILQKKFQADDRITDMQIRAQAGSLSRYSLQFSVGYDGPSITDMGADQQPNPLHRPYETRTDISTRFGAKYRITSNDTLYFSGGMKSYFSHTGGDNYDVTNPGASYDHTYMIGNVQTRTGISASRVTESNYRNKGESAGAELSHIMKWNVSDTRWIVGGTVSAANYFYNRGYLPKDKKASDIYFNFIPSIEYRLLRNLNFNTSYAVGLTHYRGRPNSTYNSDPATAHLGVGWGITRDIYVNPYFSFYPTAMAWNYTSVAMSAIFSVF